MNRIILLGIIFIVIILLDIYVYQAVRVVFPSSQNRKIVLISYFSLTFLSILAIFLFRQLPAVYTTFKTFLLTAVFIHYLCKIFVAIFLLIDDLSRGIKWLMQKTSLFMINSSSPTVDLSRSEFLSKAGLIAAAVPLVTTSYGILSGAHDYRVRKKTIYFPNLPSSFDGITIGQLSDIHSGSFFNKRAVKGGVELLLKEKPDLIFFTGDLVNNYAYEVTDYIPIFEKVKAPLGVYSTLGNHDYGDYSSWPSAEAKKNNLKNLKKAHQLLGWDLLMNENRFIKQNGDNISIIGIENWSALKRFPRYGKLNDAYKGTEESPFKILLSHDPSHWDAEVRPSYPDIDLMLAGHTHGFQFGIEIGNFRWSPAKYMYKQWADLYQEKNQYLYVNRGFGYLGYPGRIGILPEITLLTLKKA